MGLNYAPEGERRFQQVWPTLGAFWPRWSAFEPRWTAFRPRWSAFRHQASLHKCFLQLMARGSDPRVPGIALKLFELWGDPLDQDRETWLRSCLKEFDEVEGVVLLSSASLMALILGAISTGDKNRTVWCLEQNPHWANVVRSWIKRYGIKGTYVISAPPVVKSGMVCFRMDAKHLPKNIGLVLCDAPSAAAGSALSTLLSVGPHLSDEFTTLARNVKTDGDRPLIKRWAMRHGATFVLVNKRDGFIKISRRQSSNRHQPARFNPCVDEAGPK